MLHISGNRAISAPSALARRHHSSPLARLASRSSPHASICNSATLTDFIKISPHVIGNTVYQQRPAITKRPPSIVHRLSSVHRFPSPPYILYTGIQTPPSLFPFSPIL